MPCAAFFSSFTTLPLVLLGRSGIEGETAATIKLWTIINTLANDLILLQVYNLFCQQSFYQRLFSFPALEILLLLAIPTLGIRFYFDRLLREVGYLGADASTIGTGFIFQHIKIMANLMHCFSIVCIPINLNSILIRSFSSDTSRNIFIWILKMTLVMMIDYFGISAVLHFWPDYTSKYFMCVALNFASLCIINKVIVTIRNRSNRPMTILHG